MLAEKFESVDLVDGILCTLHRIEYDESLTSAPQATLCDNVQNVAILGEDLAQGLDQSGNLDALFEVSGLRDRVSVAQQLRETYQILQFFSRRRCYDSQ